MSSWACQTGGVYSGDCASAAGSGLQHADHVDVYNVTDAMAGACLPVATRHQTLRSSRPPTLADCGGNGRPSGNTARRFHRIAARPPFIFKLSLKRAA